MKKLIALMLALSMVLCTAVCFAADNRGVTREKFCELVYDAVNGIKPLPQAKLAENPFNDVMNYKINALAFSEIVCGKADRTFVPDGMITREEAAVIVYNAAVYLGVEMPLAKVDMSYSDNAEISPWSVSAIYSLKILGILDSDEKEFRPKDFVTEDDCTAALARLAESEFVKSEK